jgi:hypothetical protein
VGQVLPEIDDDLARWIRAQPMFFVGTAPSGADGLVNISPKGDARTLAILGPRRIAYVDLFGSGVETVAHLKQNARIVVMMCAFRGAPKVLRLHGRGRVIEVRDPEFADLLARFELGADLQPIVRSLIAVDVVRISDSCGFTVPVMEHKAERDTLVRTARAWIRRDGDDAIRKYCDVNNARSVDGLPGLSPFEADVTAEERRTYSAEGRKL